MQTTVGTINWRRVLNAFGVLVLIVLGLLLATRIPRTITVFIIAGFLASAVHPTVSELEARRVPRVWAITIVYVLLILTAVICSLIVLPLTIAQMQVLAADVPGFLHASQAWFAQMQDTLREHFPTARLPEQFTNIGAVSTQRINDLVNATLTSVGTLALNVATALFVALSSLILSFFFLLNDRQIAEGFASLFPASRRETARQLASEIVQVFGGFVSGQVIVSAITGVAIAVLTALVGFKFALLLGLLCAVAYSVPVIGMLAAQLLALAMAAPQGIVIVLLVQAIVFVVARISDNVLVPKIMGGSVGVSPMAVMFAVFAGGELFGVPGLILGIPAAALIKLLWRYFVIPWLHGQIEIVQPNAPLPERANEPPLAAASQQTRIEVP